MDVIIQIIAVIVLLAVFALAGKIVYDVAFRGPDPKGDPTPPEFRPVPGVDRRRDE